MDRSAPIDSTPSRLDVIDSHTEGEPTRVVLGGFPDLGGGSVAAQRDVFESRFDHLRSAVVNEPRGSDFLVGAVLVPPSIPEAVAGVIFFNNVGMLHGCGHGTIGVATTLAAVGRLSPGRHVIETPVGPVSVELLSDGVVRIENVPSRRARTDVTLEVAGVGLVRGDVAWGGNWFFLTDADELVLRLEHVDALTARARAIRGALDEQGVTGDDGGVIDHVELFGPPESPDADSRNFVLCPGGAYDRSPCGTGTSAKLACLHADDRLAPGAPWRQESVIGSVFTGRFSLAERGGGWVIPTIEGRAYLTAESTLHLDPRDPFVHGIVPR